MESDSRVASRRRYKEPDANDANDKPHSLSLVSRLAVGSSSITPNYSQGLASFAAPKRAWSPSGPLGPTPTTSQHFGFQARQPRSTFSQMSHNIADDNDPELNAQLVTPWWCVLFYSTVPGRSSGFFQLSHIISRRRLLIMLLL